MKPDMSPEEINKFNENAARETAEQYKEFKDDLAAGKCWVCNAPIDSFDENTPCQHWLLMPKGFRKKHLKLVFDAKDYDAIESFLRWYVNAKEPIRHINDLKDEHDSEKVKALTIKYDNIEWAFSFAKSCLEGKDGVHGPHYHFQMRVDGRPFHDFSDRHIKLSDYELWLLDIEQGKNPKIMKREVHGAGIRDVLDNTDTEALLKSLKSTDDYDNATFHISSMVMPKEGHQISSDEVADLMEEHNRTGVPMHQLIKKLNNVKSTVFVEPGPGIPDAANRTKHKRGKRKKL